MVQVAPEFCFRYLFGFHKGGRKSVLIVISCSANPENCPFGNIQENLEEIGVAETDMVENSRLVSEFNGKEF